MPQGRGVQPRAEDDALRRVHIRQFFLRKGCPGQGRRGQLMGHHPRQRLLLSSLKPRAEPLDSPGHGLRHTLVFLPGHQQPGPRVPQHLAALLRVVGPHKSAHPRRHALFICHILILPDVVGHAAHTLYHTRPWNARLDKSVQMCYDSMRKIPGNA